MERSDVEAREGLTDTVLDCVNRFAVFSECPHCGSALHAEHAHYRCRACGWRDSCCD